MAGTAAMQFEPAVLRNLAFDNGSQQITIGAVKAPLWSAAFAQSADSFTLDNVRFTWGAFTYEAKQVTFSGASVVRREIEGLFSSGSEPFADRLARVSAKQVIVPELKVTQKLGKGTQTILYRNVSINDVVNGKIASTTAETTAIEETGENSPTLISYGKSTITDFDLPSFARVYEAKDASAPLTKIYGAFSIEKIDAATRDGKGSVQIARLSGRDVMIRPIKDSWSSTLTFIEEMSGKDEHSSEEKTRLLQSVADLMNAFDAGLIEATGFTIKSGGKDSNGTGTIARMAYTGANGAKPAEARIEGVEIVDEETRLKVGAVSLTGFSLAPTLNGLKALEGKSLDNLDHAAMRSLIPTLGTLTITDMDIDAPAADDKPTERVRMIVGSMEITADKPRNGIPTNIRFDQRNASLSYPDNTTDELALQLRALGYKSFETSSTLAATWNEATNEIAIKEFSLDGKDMGSVRMTGLIGNVSPDLFNPDEGAASAALLSSKAKSLNIVVENRGLFDRYLEFAAKEQGATPDALRKLYAGATPLVVSSMIGNSENAQMLGKAIARFIEKPGKLTIEAQPKSASGFGVMDYMLASDPKAALEKFKITAKAE